MSSYATETANTAHISNDLIITDQDNITFGEFRQTSKYLRGLDSVRRDVAGHQHLRFIGYIYRTFDVCVNAVKNSPEYDLYAVPASIQGAVLQEAMKGQGQDSYWFLKNSNRKRNKRWNK